MAPVRSYRLFSLLLLCACLCLVFGTSCQAAAKKQPTAQELSDKNREVWLKRAQENQDIILGKASWYGKEWNARATSSGVPFDMYTFTAAHRTLPFGTIVRVTDQHNGKSVMVCVTDRGPFVKGRIIDMSYAAANRLGITRRGIASVGLEVVSDRFGRPLNDDQAFYVEAGQERFGPYETFADACAVQQTLQVGHAEVDVVLGAK